MLHYLVTASLIAAAWFVMGVAFWHVCITAGLRFELRGQPRERRLR